MTAPARILVAGAGDLGGRIAEVLRAAGHEVLAVARRPRADPRIIACDLDQPGLATLPDDIDTLVHCLAPASRDEAGYRAVYLDAPRHLRAALPNLRRIAFVSSTAVYGDHCGAEIDEAAECRPLRFNGRVLLAAEQAIAAAVPQALLLRLGGLYGPGRDLLPRRVRTREPLPVSSPPLYTNRIHIDDAAAAIGHLLARAATGVFNLVDDEPAAQDSVLDWIADQLGEPRLARVAAPAPDDNKRVLNARLRASGFRLRYPGFRDGYAALLR